MVYLGIDYGRGKIGLAIAAGRLAEPRAVLRYKDLKVLYEEIKRIVEKEKIEKVIIGVSEGEMARESRRFGQAIKESFGIGVAFADETLSSREAVKKAIEAGVPQKKRRALEDAFAAAIMLQSYLDNNV